MPFRVFLSLQSLNNFRTDVEKNVKSMWLVKIDEVQCLFVIHTIEFNQFEKTKLPALYAVYKVHTVTVA